MEWSHALFFYGRADKGNGGGIYWASKLLPILHRRPLVRYTLSLLSRHGTIRRSAVFLLDLLRTIAAKHGWFLRHGLFCIVNIDRGMAQLVLQDKRYSRITTRHAICGAAGR
ncbi:Uncharacterised protein [Salmonella enterica subsp. enterica serovar Daytona]|uniref:Uncharacterized protein n=1 Tax=Salmonella enterica subsp. enterica serovar Daytona TaxID=1962639 RepID=A0A447JIQ6_SALET|nr:Uncharacterised protein [Salmonella enterica subsp. enterica serovar Daytona]